MIRDCLYFFPVARRADLYLSRWKHPWTKILANRGSSRIGSFSGIDLLDDRLYHWKHILQYEAFTFFVVEFHSVIIFEVVGRLNNSWRFGRIIQAPRVLISCPQ